MTRQHLIPVFLLGLAVSASAFVGNVPSTRVAFATQSASKHLLTRARMVVDTQLEKKADNPTLDIANTTAIAEDECVVSEEQSETQKLMTQVKEAGTAGIVSYALWEFAFWALSVPVCIFGYREVTGHWPDFSNSDDQAKLGAEAFAFVNFARFAVPLRIGLALSTTPWIQENILDRLKKDELPECEPSNGEE